RPALSQSVTRRQREPQPGQVLRHAAKQPDEQIEQELTTNRRLTDSIPDTMPGPGCGVSACLVQ
ncbi:MAG: hypothetical protein ACRDRU_21930, partial [Pseudonocardiaceae bacterium]